MCKKTAGLLSDTEAAEYLGVSVSLIKKLARQKNITHVRIGSLYKFRQLWIDEYVQRQTTRCRADDGVWISKRRYLVIQKEFPKHNELPVEIESGPPRMTIKEAAEYLGVTEGTIKNAISGGHLTRTKIGGKLRFHKHWLEDFVERTKVRCFDEEFDL